MSPQRRPDLPDHSALLSRTDSLVFLESMLFTTAVVIPLLMQRKRWVEVIAWWDCDEQSLWVPRAITSVTKVCAPG